LRERGNAKDIGQGLTKKVLTWGKYLNSSDILSQQKGRERGIQRVEENAPPWCEGGAARRGKHHPPARRKTEAAKGVASECVT